MPTRWVAACWLMRATSSMAFQIAAATGSSGLSRSGSVLGSSTDASRSSRFSRARYGSHCVLSSHGLTSSFSPSSMVARARSSSSSQFLFALSHACCHSCSAPWAGCAWSSCACSGRHTLKYYEQ